MGHVSSLDDTNYYVGVCPPGFCHESFHYSHFFLPNNSRDLQKLICGYKNRQDTLCGRCSDGHGPAVNSPTYECVKCNDPIGDIFKYISAVYIPLVAMFVLIIVFNVRLTTGAANAFILYAQIISSTFGVEVDGQIPIMLIAGNKANRLLKAYKVPYGIFNLEFIENLIPPLCVGTHLNTLAVIALDYIIALTPLLLIIIGAIVFKLADLMGDHCCKNVTLSTQAPPRASTYLAKIKRNLSEATLPAFSAFLLLSYTKLALTPSYILSQVVLFDNKGNKIYPRRAYFAGHLSVHDDRYFLYYVIPACVVLATFVAVPPLLLLDYPLRLFEWCLSKVNCLWRYYPVGKVHFFQDTFQGCFKNKYRFFAGLYFLFRLAINLNYTFTPSWLEQFVVKEISCILMILLLALCRPYNARNDHFNRIDVLIFANLAIVNGLSFYLFEYAQSNPQAETLPISAFVIRYILIFLPLIYIIGYIMWEKTKPCHSRLPYRAGTLHNTGRPPVKYDALEESCDTLPPSRTSTFLDSNSHEDRRRFEESEDLLFQRAELLNHYKPSNSTAVIAEDHALKKNAQTNVSEDSGMRSLPEMNSGSNHTYGSTKSTSSTKETTSASAYSTNSAPSTERSSILYQRSDENSDDLK